MFTLSYNAKRKLIIWLVVFAVGAVAVVIGGCFAFQEEVEQGLGGGMEEEAEEETEEETEDGAY